MTTPNIKKASAAGFWTVMTAIASGISMDISINCLENGRAMAAATALFVIAMIEISIALICASTAAIYMTREE